DYYCLILDNNSWVF
nr:immunoglobulin light chain junction region [Macaca mulatta]MOY06720.1 immunoglobulin light chain junction region [Macaca mulatta]MOY06937.1 immunoglobulin light chain junction region [Macaca mulatta]MOY07020.1 immunoglobulin light chain junction region [Macaca mulatta]MOY07218.1 immunoglobulin light chain junction region [Macaca mulatta]